MAGADIEAVGQYVDSSSFDKIDASTFASTPASTTTTTTGKKEEEEQKNPRYYHTHYQEEMIKIQIIWK